LVVDPMASFARMVPGEWRQTALAGTSTFDTWHWGPGRRSMRVMTDGSGTAVIPEPWRELQVFYWHPGRKQICFLGLSPYAGGVSEGTIRFDGETADGVFDLHQSHGRRKLGLRWVFDGLDHYRDILLEETGPKGLQPMNEWDHYRTQGPPAPRPRFARAEPTPSGKLSVFEPLLGHTWDGWIGTNTADALHIRSSFAWIPYADGIYARTVAMQGDRESTHLFDTYFFHHTGTGALRALALSHDGGVYEGDVRELEGGALEIDSKGYEGDQVVEHRVRFDFEHAGTLRQRVWSSDAQGRRLVLDVHHEKFGPQKD